MSNELKVKGQPDWVRIGIKAGDYLFFGVGVYTILVMTEPSVLNYILALIVGGIASYTYRIAMIRIAKVLMKKK